MISKLTSTGGWNRGEIYAGGRHLATYVSSTTFFAHGDWLATPRRRYRHGAVRIVGIGPERARTDAQGALAESCQGLPFGHGLSCSGSDVSPLHFTGKQRDSETGLALFASRMALRDDYFGARYDSSSTGRFMTPDPLPWISWQSGSRGDHQRFAGFLLDPKNLDEYAYALNNPVSATDPTGLYVCSGSSSDCQKIENAYKLLQQAAKNAKPGSQESKDINRALKALGRPGQKNGVTVRTVKGSAWEMNTGTVAGQTTITVEITGIEQTLRTAGAANMADEEASLLGHEATHAADQRITGMPKSSQQETAAERRAYTTQGEVDEALHYQSVYGLWSPSGGLSQSGVDFMANSSLQIWCSEGNKCR